MTIKQIVKLTSRHKKCQHMKESNTLAINVTQILLRKGASRNTQCQYIGNRKYIGESNTHAINVTQN